MIVIQLCVMIILGATVDDVLMVVPADQVDGMLSSIDQNM